MDRHRYIVLITKKEILMQQFRSAIYEKQITKVEEIYKELCCIFREILNDLDRLDHVHKAINHYEYGLIRDQYRVFCNTSKTGWWKYLCLCCNY
jgi:hypothetical protein